MIFSSGDNQGVGNLVGHSWDETKEACFFIAHLAMVSKSGGQQSIFSIDDCAHLAHIYIGVLLGIGVGVGICVGTCYFCTRILCA